MYRTLFRRINVLVFYNKHYHPFVFPEVVGGVTAPIEFTTAMNQLVCNYCYTIDYAGGIQYSINI